MSEELEDLKAGDVVEIIEGSRKGELDIVSVHHRAAIGFYGGQTALRKDVVKVGAVDPKACWQTAFRESVFDEYRRILGDAKRKSAHIPVNVVQSKPEPIEIKRRTFSRTPRTHAPADLSALNTVQDTRSIPGLINLGLLK